MALPQPSIAQLRPALQLALDTAAAAGPGRRLPGRVRSLIRSRRLPATWAVTMAQALEEDEPFRSWIAAEASEEALGRVAWLWLTRPGGWEDQLAELVEAAAAVEELDKEARLAAERAASLERELASTRQELASARAAQSELTSGVEEERRAWERAEAERREELLSELAAREGRIERLEVQGEALRAERDALSARVGRLEEALANSERARAEAEERATGLATASQSARREAEDRHRRTEQRRSAVAGAVERAAAAASELGDALAAAARALAPGPDGTAAPPAKTATMGPAGPAGTLSGPVASPSGGGPVASPSGRGAVASPSGRGAVASPSGRGPAASSSGPDAAVPAEAAGDRSPAAVASARRARRTPLRGATGRPVNLPLGIMEDAPEAAAFLVRVPDAHLVVDGYNVALTSWADPPGRPEVTDLPALRRRLLDALAELSVRIQRPVTVVFDGIDEGGRVAASGPARPWLRVVFSASSVEADEVIVHAVRRLRPSGPVVVATNDREVRDGALRHGANVVSVGQLLGVLKRHTPM